MNIKRVSLRTVVGMVAGAAALVLGSVYVARASPGGATANALSFAGTLTGTTGKQTLTFTFKKGSATACSPAGIDVAVTPDPGTGSFLAAIPLGGCPNTLFDGSDVTMDVSVGGMPLAMGQPVNPVPYAKYADQVGSADCPVGYARAGTGTQVVCARGSDEVVKVGTGASAFWIDRYEATVWTTPDGPVSGAQKFAGSDDSSPNFPKNGQVLTPLYALSVAGVTPANFINWFQAAEACRASGKRLPTGNEWLAAARGTRDPGANDGTASNKCNTQAAAVRNTGLALGSAVDTSCVSDWGAEDMIGNRGELTADWYAAPPMSATELHLAWPDPPGSSLNGDSVWAVSSYAAFEGGAMVQGMPGVASRGGVWYEGVGAGIFDLAVDNSPSLGWHNLGFRCMVPR